MTSLVYGKRTPVYHGTDAEAFFEGIKLLSIMADTAAFPPVEIMPFLKYIPHRIAPVSRQQPSFRRDCLSLTSLKQWGAHIEKTSAIRDRLNYRLLAEAEDKLRNNVQTGSYVEEILMNSGELGLSRDEIVFVRLPIYPTPNQLSELYQFSGRCCHGRRR